MSNLNSHTFNLQFLYYTYKKIFRFWKFDAFIRQLPGCFQKTSFLYAGSFCIFEQGA